MNYCRCFSVVFRLVWIIGSGCGLVELSGGLCMCYRMVLCLILMRVC